MRLSETLSKVGFRDDFWEMFSVMKVWHKCKVLGADGIEITFVTTDISDMKH